MQITTYILLVALSYGTTPTAAVPINPTSRPSILTARSQYCYNAPHTKAGT